MKKIILLFTLVYFGLASCTKDTKSNLPTTYRVDNISDAIVSYQIGASTTLSYSVTYVGPIQETVDLSLTNLPAGITADTIYAHSGIPTFYSYFVLTNDGTAKGGVYPIKLLCHGSKTGDKFYTFNLKVLREPQCTSLVSGAWKNNYDCNGNLYTDSIIVDPAGYSNRVYFTNFNGTGVSIYAELDCNGGYINIPAQTVGGHTYSGNGNFAGTNIGYTFQDVSASGTVNCFDNMSR